MDFFTHIPSAPLDIFGYICMMCVVIAMSMKGEKRIRIANIISSSLWTVYAWLIYSPATVFLNIATIIINVFVLVLTAKGKKVPKWMRINGKGKLSVWARAPIAGSIILALSVIVCFVFELAGIEILGMFAALLLLYGFLQEDEKRIRSVCVFASGCYIVYAVLIGSWPMVISNSIVCAIHVFKLNRLYAVHNKEKKEKHEKEIREQIRKELMQEQENIVIHCCNCKFFYQGLPDDEDAEKNFCTWHHTVCEERDYCSWGTPEKELLPTKTEKN